MPGAELTEARVRLEGQLERLEQARAAFDDATRALAERRVDGVVDAVRRLESPEYLAARQQAARLRLDSPALRDFLLTLDRAEAQLRSALQQRASRLHLDVVSLQATAARLEEEPPLYESKPRARAPVVFGGPVALWLGFALAVSFDRCGAPSAAGLVAPALVLVALISIGYWFTARQVIVTRRRIVLDAGSFLLTPDVVLRISHDVESGAHYELELPSLPRERQHVDLSRVWSAELDAALQRCDHPPTRTEQSSRVR